MVRFLRSASRVRDLAAGVLMAAIIAAGQAWSHASQLQSDPATAEATLRLIVLGTRDEAQRVLELLRSGSDFSTLARTLSQDPSADDGGLLGRTTLSVLRQELREALKGVGVGQISPVVEIPTGFAVLKVVPDAEASGNPDARVSPAVVAAGSVKYALVVAGFGEATLMLRQFEKPADWNRDPQTICRMRTESLAWAETALEQDLAAGGWLASADPFDYVQAHISRGQLHSYRGKMDDAIRWFRKAYDLAASRTPALQYLVGEVLGIAHLHKAGLDNGLDHAPGDRCLLSAGPGHALAKTADVQMAIEYFSRYLADRPDDLEVKWLLNLAHMAAGTYPHQVPAAHLIARSAFASSEDVGRFVDVARQAGLASVAAAGGVIVDDFDNDGRLDVVTSSIDSCAAMRFFRRGDDGLFVEQAAKAGLSRQVGGLNMVQTDYDNDGRLDILVLRGGWELPQRKSLLRGNRDGTFTDVTEASGLTTPTSTQAAVWTDIDQDGYLDLFVGNEDGPAQLFLNRQDGTFTDIAEKAGVRRSAFSKGAAAADYDNDGWPDLYVSNSGGRNFLYRNNRNGTFTELGRTAGVPGVGQGFATWFFDYDNDGWQDLFVTSYFTSIDETARTYLGLPHNANTLKLYRNLANGRFQDVTRLVGLDKVFMPMGANYGDIDNDGFLDIYLGTGNPSYASLVPSVLLRNKDGKSFVDVTTSSGTGELHKGHGVAFADLDHDGDEEIVFEVGGATPGDAHALRLFQNPGHGNRWIALKLTGRKTNRAAIGARIAVTVESSRGRRTLHRTVGSGGSFGASPLQQHIGLGDATRIVEVEVWWPTSNTRQRFADVAMDQFLEITEFAPEPARLVRPALPLGRSTHDADARTR